MIDKAKIVAAARANLARKFPRKDKSGLCLYATVFLLKELYKQTGIKAQIQAGTMSWRAVSLEKDTGGVTHYSYVWSPNELPSILAMMHGNMPEVHVWAAIIETQEIIDITTCYLPQRFSEIGMEWSAPLPPDFLWCKAKDIPDCIYKPELGAMHYVHSVLNELHKKGKI